MSVAATTRRTGMHQAFPRDPTTIMTSIEPGENWSWCYIDELAMELPP